MNPIVQRSGGWFVQYPDGVMGGPWKTKEAAELAAKGFYLAAAKAERNSMNDRNDD